MIRRIIKIDENKCNGCGICANACHEGAIDIINGKAKLTREHYCDGLGDCLPACPEGAISFEEREAPEYDHEAVMANKKRKSEVSACKGAEQRIINTNTASSSEEYKLESRLRNWPVQIKLAPIQSPYFDGADILIAADCTAYSYADFHNSFINGKTVLIGCTKLDAVDYSEKLTEIFNHNDIKSITVLRMEVPCCGGMEYAVKAAINNCNKYIDVNVVTISIDGKILQG